MQGPWVINGVTVDPIYLLMDDADRIGAYLDSMDDDHPDLQEWVERYNGIWAKIAEARKWRN